MNSGMELAADEPRMDIGRQFDHLAQVLGRRAGRDDEAGSFELVDVVVVHLRSDGDGVR